MKLAQLSEDDRPREKFLLRGKESLTDSELLAILIGSGNKELNAVELAHLILAEADHDLNKLARLTVEDLQKFNGVGEAKAITIASAMELARRKSATNSFSSPQIKSSHDAFVLLGKHLQDKEHEEFWLLLLSRSNKVLKEVRVSVGGRNATVVDPKIVFNLALNAKASGVILAHNHPSGNLTPSQEDLNLTKKLISAGQVLDIQILDHLILADNAYFSFADEGLMG